MSEGEDGISSPQLYCMIRGLGGGGGSVGGVFFFFFFFFFGGGGGLGIVDVVCFVFCFFWLGGGGGGGGGWGGGEWWWGGIVLFCFVGTSHDHRDSRNHAIRTSFRDEEDKENDENIISEIGRG